MSEEVYFNEPGYEHESGTEQGEAKNNAYSNIVTLCNMKHAMTGMIKNPPVGFELVVRTHFWLKKDLILKNVIKWRKVALNNEASYKALVMDHNHKYCDKFNKEPEAYFTQFDEQVELLKETLNSLEAPNVRQLLSSKVNSQANRDKSKKEEKVDLKKDAINFDNIDMTYEDEDADNLNKNKGGISVDDAGVKDRWSRYIGVMGIEAVRKQAAAQVLLSGIDSLGVEIAKNVILSGVKRITLHDDKKASWGDLSG
jgi:ThiF family